MDEEEEQETNAEKWNQSRLHDCWKLWVQLVVIHTLYTELLQVKVHFRNSLTFYPFFFFYLTKIEIEKEKEKSI